MRIALLTNGIWPITIGGIEKHSFYLIKYLSHKNVAVDIYYIDPQGKTTDWELYLNKEQLSHINFIPIKYAYKYSFPGHYIYESYKMSEYIYQRLIASDSQYDFIYAQGFTAWYSLKKKYPVKIIVNFHGLNMFQPAPGFKDKLVNQLMAPFVKWNIRQADYTQSLGGNLTEILLKLGIQKNKIFECGIGMDESWFDFHEKEWSEVKSFVFIGRNSVLKGIKELNSALEKYKNDPFKKFYIIGPITDRVVADNVIYLGEVKQNTVIKKTIEDADYLLLTSWTEGLPTVILEAMAKGRPAIATNVGAVNELVSENTGFLIKANSSEQLIKAIEAAIRLSPAQYHNLAINGYQLVSKKFRWNYIIEKMISFFNAYSDKTK